MNELTKNPILKFNPNQMMEVRKLFGYEDLNRLQQDVILLQDWIKKQQHFPVMDYDKPYLERRLICSKGSIERAKKLMDKLCTLRGLMPDYLQGFDIENEFNVLWDSSYICMWPAPTPDNCRILHINFYNPKATGHEAKATARYLLLIVEYIQLYDYNAGLHLICDSRHITLGVISQINPFIIRNTLMLITEAIGLRVHGLHFISGSKLLDSLLTICKSGLSQKLKSRIHVHESYDAMSKFIPKDIIPKDLGGEYPSTVKEISEQNFKEFSSPEFVRRIKYFEGAVTDESKRLSSKFNEEYSGMPGSFKVLSVD